MPTTNDSSVTLHARLRLLENQLQAAQQALHQYERHFHHTLSALQEQVHITVFDNQQYQVELLAPGLADITGQPLEALAQHAGFWLRAVVHPHDRSVVDAHLRRLLNGQRSVIECRVLRPDGDTVWVQDSAHPAFDDGSGALTLYGALLDITLRKAAEAALREGELMALDAQKARAQLQAHNEFLLAMWHEFKSPLTQVTTSSDLLARYGERFDEAERQARLATIIEQARHLSDLLDGLATIVSAEAGQPVFKPRVIDLGALCAEVIETVRVSDAQRHPITLEHRHTISALNLDPRLLRHILGNLLSNAVRYSPPDSEIRCKVEVSPTYIVIHVSDQGIGIPTGDLGQIFESFRRGSNVGEIDGTGLGLKIVRDAVTLHKGFVSVQSEVGRGTTFSVTLPLL